jgi:hypothetical protein
MYVDQMTDDQMSDDQMSDDKMSDDQMSDDKMSVYQQFTNFVCHMSAEQIYIYPMSVGPMAFYQKSLNLAITFASKS